MTDAVNDIANDEINSQHTVVGELLATGYTSGEILIRLQTIYEITLEEAQTLLRDVYDSWESVKVGLNLQLTDERNWHQHLRMKLLQQTLKSTDTPSLRLALQILDSLAELQDVLSTVGQTIPLPIILVEATEADRPVEEPKEPTIDKG